MSTGRSGHILAMLNGELHAIAETTEKYNADTNTWVPVGDMSLPGFTTPHAGRCR